MPETALAVPVSPDLEPAQRALRIALPDPLSALEQDEEWFLYEQDGVWREVRLHDYEAIFDVQGLYERVVYDIFACVSPGVVGDLLVDAMLEAGVVPAEQAVLDLGAGNGCVAEALFRRGFERFVGADIARNAAEAAERDRPGLYEAFAIGDLTDLPAGEIEKVTREFGVMTCVAALGFGDIPSPVFMAAFDRVAIGGWAAFTIKSDFLDESDTTGFATLIRGLRNDGRIEIVAQRPYRHRYASSGEAIEYTAVVARKLA